jgi:hypothetical protein
MLESACREGALSVTERMGDVVQLPDPKPMARAVSSADPVTRQEDEGEYESDGMGESEIERARRLPLAPIRQRS